MKLEPKTLVTVFGKHKGIVIAPGKAKGPDGMTRVEYRDAATGAKVAAYIDDKEVEKR